MKHWACWDEHETFYLTELAPTLIANPQSGDETEQRILRELRAQMRDDEWKNLPRILADRRAEILREIESEREAAAQAGRERLRRKRMLEEIDHQFDRNFLSADRFFESASSGIVSREEYENRKLTFVRHWFERAASRRKEQKFYLDDEQLSAIAAVNGNVQVIARAGSGKTATLVNRTLFLLEHCRVPSTNILLLAFNRKAAIEIRRRLLGLIHEDAEHQIKSEISQRRQRAKQKNARKIDWSEIEADSVAAVATRLKVALPQIMTFHALAYAIVHPDESILYNGAEGESQVLSRVFQSVIDNHLQIQKYEEAIRELMLAHFKEDWERIVARGHDLPKDDLLRIRRSLPHESLRGEYIKSYGEKLIADFLFEHGIAYKYEHNHWWGNINY